MQQYFVEQPLVLQKEQQLTNDQCHHILHVMRMRSGDVVRLADDSGAVMLAELRVQEGRVWALPTSIVPAAQEGAPITLIMGLIKGERWEWAIQKAAELGAARIVRWQTIAREASEQCKRSTIMKVERPITMRELADVRSDHNLIAYERCDATSRSLAGALRGHSPASISVMIGCEGGFSEEEAMQAKELGFAWVSRRRQRWPCWRTSAMNGNRGISDERCFFIALTYEREASGEAFRGKEGDLGDRAFF